MAEATLELTATADFSKQPVIWRLAKLYNVVTRIRRARVTEDYGYLSVELEGSKPEIEMASSYLKEIGWLGEVATQIGESAGLPETAIPQNNTIAVRLKTVAAEQGQTPLLYRIGKDFDVVVNIESALFDEEEGGVVDISISGALMDVQRAIAYLHTTGLSVNPRQRSVSDGGNL